MDDCCKSHSMRRCNCFSLVHSFEDPAGRPNVPTDLPSLLQEPKRIRQIRQRCQSLRASWPDMQKRIDWHTCSQNWLNKRPTKKTVKSIMKRRPQRAVARTTRKPKAVEGTEAQISLNRTDASARHNTGLQKMPKAPPSEPTYCTKAFQSFPTPAKWKGTHAKCHE